MTEQHAAAVFDEIYETNAWNGTESRSGPGSGSAATYQVAEAISIVAAGVGARRVLDVGCGDGYWMPELPGYIGVDVSAAAIARARELNPRRRYELIREAPDGLDGYTADLVICRDAIQHLPLEVGRRLLEAISERAMWLLASTYIGTPNDDVPAGAYYSPDLTAPPFNLPPPLLLIVDGWDYETGTTVRDPSKFLGLWHAADAG